MVNEQIQQNIRTSLQQTKQEWSDYLINGKKGSAILTILWEDHPEKSQRAQQVLGWIDKALKTDTLVGYQELYQKWNGDPDLNKYNAKNDAGGALSTFRDYLDEWVNPAQPALTTEQQKKLDDYDKLVKDLDKFGIKKDKVKESIELYTETIESVSSSEYLNEIQAQIKQL